MSEFAGCNRALGGILRVNPYNVEDIAKAIDMIIQTKEDEREQRLLRAYTYIKQHTAEKWSLNFIKDLKRHASNSKDHTFQFIGWGLQSTIVKTQANF